MLSRSEAEEIIEKTFPKARIKSPVDYKGAYVFGVFDDTDEFEGDMDPFYSVDKTTGQVSDFSLFYDIDTKDLSLFTSED